MTASTSKYGFPFEVPGDQPGVSLSGGPSGTEDILAEKVETELERIDDAADSLDGRVSSIEDVGILGWTYIANGLASAVSDFVIDLTDGGRLAVGEFDLLRLHMRYGLDAVGTAFLQINSDGAGGTGYLHAALIYDATGNLDIVGFVQSGSWRIGDNGTVGNGNLTCTIYHTNGNNAHSFQSESARHSTSDSSMRWGKHWGNVSGLAATPSTLRLVVANGATQFTNAWWWVEGFRTP